MMSEKLTRRQFLQKGGILATGILAASMQDQERHISSDIPQFASEILGTNVSARAIEWYGLPLEKTLDNIFSLPGKRVRIAIPFDEVHPKEKEWYFDKADLIIQKAIDHGKIINLQIGVKTIGYPEVHIPLFLRQQFPYLMDPNTQIDQDPHVQEHILTYLDKVSKRYLSLSGISTIHVENEAFSKNLPVARGRYITTDFNEQEIAVVKDNDPFKRPIVQNLPIDTPRFIPYVLDHANIVGVNVYNQAGNAPYVQNILHFVTHPFFAPLLSMAKNKYGTQLFVTEYQTAPWINEHRQPVHPFELATAVSGLRDVQRVNPDGLFLWDIEQVMWRAQQGETKALEVINLLAA